MTFTAFYQNDHHRIVRGIATWPLLFSAQEEAF